MKSDYIKTIITAFLVACFIMAIDVESFTFKWWISIISLNTALLIQRYK